jgi:hypothetical protein
MITIHLTSGQLGVNILNEVTNQISLNSKPLLCTISIAYTNMIDYAPFWWLLFHLDLDMLVIAPSTSTQSNNQSIHNIIKHRINAIFSGDIE